MQRRRIPGRFGGGFWARVLRRTGKTHRCQGQNQGTDQKPGTIRLLHWGSEKDGARAGGYLEIIEVV